jgi:hypothetical protein
MAARFGSTDADEFTLQQQNAKTKAAIKYAVKFLSDFMLEKNYDGEIGTMDIVVLRNKDKHYYPIMDFSQGNRSPSVVWVGIVPEPIGEDTIPSQTTL